MDVQVKKKAFINESGHGVTQGTMVAVDDLVGNCGEIKAGQEVVLSAHIDRFYGGDNVVDERVIACLQAAIRHGGAVFLSFGLTNKSRPMGGIFLPSGGCNWRDVMFL